MKLFANLRGIKSTWPMLKAARGHLVMIGGGTARTRERRLSLVSAVNCGIAALSESITEQGLQDCIHVNLVQPGTIQTSRRKRLMEKLAGQEGISYAEYLTGAPRRLKISRLGEPGDVAELVAFLATEEAKWIHGAIIEEEVTRAIEDALQLGTISFDAVRHLLLCRIERRPPRLDTENYPHLPLVQVCTTQATDYMALLMEVGA